MNNNNNNKIRELIANYENGELSKAEIKRILQGFKSSNKKQLLTEGQKGLFTIQKACKESTAYNIPICFDIDNFHLASFIKACEFIMEQYPNLNSKFIMDNDVPYRVEEKHKSLNLTIEDSSLLSDDELFNNIRKRIKVPFDLERGPLFRVFVFNVSNRKSVILINIHHIIFDGGSVPILLGSLYKAYEDYLEGREPKVERLNAIYSDYVEREEKYIEDKGDVALEYWRKKLNGPLSKLNLPIDKAHSSEKTKDRGKTWSQFIKMEDVKKIQDFARKHRTYSSAVLFAVYSILLHKHSQQNDIVIGMPVNQRNHKGFEKLVGLCINMIPIRSEISKENYFVDYLNNIQKDIIDGMAYSYPFPLIMRKLNLGYDSAFAPVFQTVFAYQDVLDSLLEKDNDFQLNKNIHQEGEYDITLEVVNKLDGIQINWKYDFNIFEKSTIMSMGEHFINILHEVIENETIKVSDISMLTKHETDIIMNQWNNTEVDFIQEKCINQLFEKKAEAKAKDIAVIYEDGLVSYEELNSKANALATYLWTKGVSTGDLVAVYINRSLDMVIALLGILKLGAAYVPMDPETPIERLKIIFEDSKAKVVITDSKTSEYVSKALTEDVYIVDMEKERDRIFEITIEEDVISKNNDLDKLAYVIYTSGTTNKPKGVCVSHRSVLNTLYFLEKQYSVKEGDRCLLKTNYTFDVSITELFGWFVGNGSLVIAPVKAEKSPKELVECVIKYKITHINFVPSMLNLFYNVAKKFYESGDMLYLKYIFVAGEAFPKELADRCVKLFDKVKIENIYGPTEASIYATYFSCENIKDDLVSISIGKPIANTKIYILDRETNNIAPIGIPGELCIAGTGLAKEYLNNEELTNKAFIENPMVKGERLYRTGDLARWKSDGVIEYLGRLDLQVKVRGFRIQIDEIEYQLANHDDIKDCAVISRGQGENTQLVAYFVPNKDNGKVDSQELKKYLASKIPSYMVPDLMIELESLPITKNGKLDRKNLINRKITLHKNKKSKVIKDNVKNGVLKIWKDVLKVEDLETTDAFFEVGGNSLLAVKLTERIRLEFNYPFDLTDLFKYPNIDSMSKYLSEVNNKSIDLVEKSEVTYDKYKKDYPEYYRNSAAVIGISCNFPGAKDYHQFWNNLMKGKNSVVYVDDNTLEESNLPKDILNNPNFIPVKCSIENKDYFDGEFFKLSPNHVDLMDPQFRALLIHSWRAVEDAGHNHKDIPNTAVYVSAANHNYAALNEEDFRVKDVIEDPEQYLSWVYSQSGTISSMISYQLGFTGQSLAVHSNCSSSLTALDLAYNAVISGKVDYALVATASISPLDRKGYIYQQGLNFSSDGKIKTFDEKADGMIGGEGVGAILIKRASDAIESNDNIYGLLRGIATNSDGGDASGFYSPSVNGQERVIKRVINETKVNPETIKFIESHGTGTKLGDPIEFRALSDVYRSYTDRKNYCGISSLKPNIGHLDTAAGIAGCIKVLLSLYNREIPPTINYFTSNPKMKVNESPFYIVDEAKEWKEEEYPRRAALNAIGLGGTNAHAIFEEYVDKKNEIKVNEIYHKYVIPISAREESTLKSYVEELCEYIKREFKEDKKNEILGNIAYTFQVGRATMAHRVAFIVSNINELLESMKEYLKGEKSSNYLIATGKNSKSQLLEDNLTLKDNYLDIANAWVSGISINWTTLYEGNIYKRLSLPTYSFNLKAYKWKNSSVKQISDSKIVMDIIHPLVHKNISTFEKIKYRCIFTGDEFFLSDHVVSGKKIMPAVSILEMIRVSINHASQNKNSDKLNMKFKNITWISPILVTNNGKTIDIELVLMDSKSGKEDRIKFKVISFDDNELITHVEGEVLINSLEEPVVLDIKDLLGKASKASIEKYICYSHIKASGIEYGDSFKVIDNINRGEKDGDLYAVADLSLPENMSYTFNEYKIHPSMLDGAIQASIGLVSDDKVEKMKAANESIQEEKDVMVPFSMNSIEVYKECTKHMYSIARNSNMNNNTKLLDIDLVDEKGVTCVSMRGILYRKINGKNSNNKEHNLTSKQNSIIPLWVSVNSVKNKNDFNEELENSFVFDEDSTYYLEIKKINENCKYVSIRENETVDELRVKLSKGNVNHIIWFAPDRSNDNRSLIEDQDMGMMHLFRLINATLKAGYGVKNLRWTIVTFNTQKVNPKDEVKASHAGVHGLVGSLAKEYEHWNIRLVDIEKDKALDIEKIFDLPSSTKGKTLALRNSTWYEQELRVIETNLNSKTKYKEHGVYVVIGGAGGVGELWTKYMIEHYKANIIWIGRRGINEEILNKVKALEVLAKKNDTKAPMYISADVCNNEQLENAYKKIKESYSCINGVIHSAIVLADKSLVNMDEELFKSVTSVKINGSVNMVQVFSREPLDFILFFSSIESFVRDAGQANYASGCTFIDSFAESIARQNGNMIAKTMNWGYWGSVGIVSDTFYKERMAFFGFTSLDEGDAMVELERFVSGKFNQLALVNTIDDKALKILGVSGKARELENVITNVLVEENILNTITVDTRTINRLKELLPKESLFDITLNMVCIVLMDIAIDFGNEERRIELSKLYNIIPNKLHRWLDESKRLIIERGFGKEESEDYLIINEELEFSMSKLWEEWNSKKYEWINNDFKAQIRLLENCLKVLKNILLGKTRATDIIFPNSSIDSLDGIYKGGAIVDFFNSELSNILCKVVKVRLKDDPDAKIRILEVGAGTGGTTTKVLQDLKEYSNSIAEYCYTDISKAFLIYAEETFKAGNPWLKTKILNIEDKPVLQGFEEGYYDIVISTNALHATANIRNTMRNVKSVMKENAVVLLNEMCSNNILSHVTFGLLDGWWLYNDEELRITGSPGLTGEKWIDVLSELGYRYVELPGKEAKCLAQQIIVATSDGVIVTDNLFSSEEGEIIKINNTSIVQNETEIISQKVKLMEATEDYLKNLISKTLKVSEANLDVNRDLDEYGLDSILVVKLNNNLAKTFQNLESTILFEYKTINEIGIYLIKERQKELKVLFKDFEEEDILKVEDTKSNISEDILRKECTKYLKNIISNALKVDDKDIDDDVSVFEYGLDSILIIKVNNAFALDFSDLDNSLVFDNFTISDLTEYFISSRKKELIKALGLTIESKEINTKSKDLAIVKDSTVLIQNNFTEKKKVSRLSYTQQGIWALQKAYPESTSYNVPMCLKVKNLDMNGLKKAYEYTVLNNPVLNIVLNEENGKLFMFEKGCNIPEILQIDITNMSLEKALEYVKEEDKKPFDIEEGPISRMCVYHMANNEALVLFNVHHIVFDGQSLMIFMKMLFSTYENVVEGNKLATLIPLASYSDYVSREEKLVNSNEGAKRLRYWKDKFNTIPELLELYKDYSTKDESVSEVSIRNFSYSLKGEENSDIAKAVTNLNIYPSTIFMAMLNVLLYKYSEQTDIVLGMPLNNREEDCYENVIGNFVNMIPIRSNLNISDTVRTVCKTLQGELIKHISNSYPFSLLVRELGITTELGKSPLFNIAFMYQNWVDGDSLKSKTFKYVDGINQDGEYELILEVMELPGENKAYSLNWKYNSKLYSEETISRLNEHYINLLNNFINNPNQCVRDIDIMSPYESNCILNTWNDTKVEYPYYKGVHELFSDKAKEIPYAIALESSNNKITYDQLDKRSDRLASYLKSLGIGKGDFVAIYIDHSVELVIGLLGILKAGAAYIPLDPVYPNKRIAYILSDSKAKIVLTRNRLKENIQSIINSKDIEMDKSLVITIDKDSTWKDELRGETSKSIENVNSQDLAYVIYTSGSTGNPKGVMIHHQALTNFLCSMGKYPGIKAEDTMFAVTTHCFDIAALELFLPLIKGATCYICDATTARNGDALKDLIEKVKPTIMQATPSTWLMLINCGWRNNENIKVLCGGEAMTESLRNQLCQLSSEVWNLYGPTETTIWSTINKVNKNEPITIGRPIDNTKVYILNGSNKPTSIGIPGELCIAGDGVSKGYWNKEEMNLEKFVTNPVTLDSKMYRTGDLSRWRADGRIEYLGRIDSQVKIRGYRIEIGEIEIKLMQHPSIDQCVVIDKVLGEEKQLVAYFEKSKEGINIESNDFKEYLANTLPNYMIPNYYIEVEELPHTPNGKVDRKALKAREVLRKAPLGVKVSNGNYERDVLDIFKEVLGREDISIDEGFFELGGNSVSLTIVVNKIRSKFNTSFTATEMFKYPKVRDIAAYISKIENKVDRDIMPNLGETHNITEEEKLNNEEFPEYYKSSVAIIGVSCQLPGANNCREFWDNLVNGVESVKVYSKDELKDMNVHEDKINNKHFVATQSTIEGKEYFDAKFFKVSAKDAEVYDPQLRLLLSNSWKAIEDSGYTPDDISDSAVYMSSCNSQYQESLMNGEMDSEALANFLLSQMGTIPTMISYKLGFKGPSMFIHTNCSSSLVGLSVAFNAIQSKQCTHALVGGATVHASSDIGYLYEKGLSLSSDGHCKAFDEDADGMIGGEGVVVLLLKDAMSAIRDKDNIYALIRGVAVNNDGNNKTGFYAPSVSGQTSVIKKALKETNINPDTISYVEAHGTGTKLGDPIEVQALSDAYRVYTNRNQYCAIGSVKSNIGHLDSASGLVGCLKAALTINKKCIAPSINYNKPNSHIDFETSPFYVADKLINLKEKETPLRVGVSSFGIGGTNVHAILEAPEKNYGKEKEDNSTNRIFIVPISTASEENLKQYVVDILDYLHSSKEEIDIESLAYTLQLGRVPMKYRVVFVVKNINKLMESMKLFIENKEDSNYFIGDASNKIEFLFGNDDESFIIEHWISNGSYMNIAKWWVTGGKVNWSCLYKNNLPYRISVPTYPFNKEAYWLKSKKLETVEKPKVVVDDKYLMMTLEECWEKSEIQQGSLKEEKTIICFIDNLAKRERLSNYIDENNVPLKIIYVGKGTELQEISDTEYLIDNNETDELIDLFESISNNYSKISTVLYMWTIDDNRKFDDMLYTIGIVQSIAKSSLKVSEVIVAGTYKDDIEEAYLDSLIGLERSIKQVILDITVRVVMSKDLASADYWMPIITKELYNKDSRSALYIDGVRHVNKVKPVKVSSSNNNVIRDNGTYVITGGTGGIGRKLAEYLVITNNANVILIGRSIFDVLSSEWVKNLGHKSSHITYWRTDVSDYDELLRFYQDYKKNYNYVDGVFHLAGVVEKTILIEKNLEDVKKVLSPKIQGTLAIEKVFGEETVDFICHFSSIASIIGDFGSCDYAIASRFQSSLLNTRKKNNTLKYPVYSINWPFLEYGGMGSSARNVDNKKSLDKYMESSAQKPLNFKNVIKLLLEVLGSNTNSISVLYVKNGEMKQVFSKDTNKILVEEPKVLDMDVSFESDVVEVIDVDVKEDNHDLISIVKDIIKALLKLNTEDIDINESFFNLGFDSFRLAQFAGKLSDKFEIKLSPSVLFDYSTILDLVNYMIGKYHDDVVIMKKNDIKKVIIESQNSEDIEENKYNEENLKEDDAIAIIGMSGLFPEAKSIDKFWENLVKGRDSIKLIPKSRFDVDKYYSEDGGKSKIDCKWMGYIEEVAEFDPLFFETSPREAMTMDPRQRHLLMESWKALEDAGIGKDELESNTVGVFVGVESGDYNLLSKEGTITSNNDSILASRVAYFLNISGPVLGINTACSSGLVAVHEACNSLRHGECDIAIVCAANFVLAPESFISMSEAGMLSKTGKCHSFDKSADGMVPGEAVTVLVLKGKEKAEKDDNAIYSLIIGSGINYDGRTNGITAPSGRAQKQLLRSVYEKYKINPADIGHVVTHGTATRLGDPIEINALKEVFEDVKGERNWCAITSTKTNIGHTFSASGIVSLIALSESIRNGIIPPSLNCNNESDFIQWNESPFYVNKSVKEWSTKGNKEHIGAVSAFGMSGTNAHVVLKEYVPKPYIEPEDKGSYLLVLSAKTKEAFNKLITSMIDMFKNKTISQSTIGRISDILAAGRHHFRYRCAIIAHTPKEAVDLWQNVLEEGEKSLRTGVVERNFSPDSTTINKIKLKNSMVKNNAMDSQNYRKYLEYLAKGFLKGYDLYWNKNDIQSIIKTWGLPYYPFSYKSYWYDEKGNFNKDMNVNLAKRESLVSKDVEKDKIGNGKDSKSENIIENQSLITLKSLDNYIIEKVFNNVISKPNNIELVPIKEGNLEFKEAKVEVIKNHDVLEDLKVAVDINFKGMVPTLNRTGVMVENLIPYSEEFADYAGMCGGEVLDIGCAYGVATIAAIEKGAKVLAVDIEQKHLDILKQRIKEEFLDYITLKQGKIPNIDFEENRFTAIHASRVIHFLKPDEVSLILKKMYSWLKPGGKMFLSTDSPYFGYWQSKVLEYEQRKAKGDSWPGYIDNIKEKFDLDDVKGAPDIINALDPDVLERECSLAGFTIDKSGFFGGVGLDRHAQDAPHVDMEHVGIIATKPKFNDPLKEKQSYTVVSEDGANISYEVSGRSDKAIVFVNGLGCNVEFWENQVKYFSKRYCVINIELAGHGKSSTGNRDKWTIEAYAKDVASVINNLEISIRKAVLVGHSIGGPIIVEAEHLIKKVVVKGLIGVDTLHNIIPKKLNKETLKMVVEAYLDSSVKVEDMFLKGASEKDIEFVKLARNLVSKKILEESYAEMVMYLQNVKDKIHTPLTLINSSSWISTNTNAHKEYGIDLEFIENVGHFSMIEAPDELNNLIEKSIEKYISGDI